MKPKIELSIIKEDVGYTAVGQWKNRSLITCGDTWEELQSMIVEMLNLSFEDLGYAYTIDEVGLTYDPESFFDFYHRAINASALAERIGMNRSLLAQYFNGIRKPSAKQTKRIVEGVRAIGKELSEVNLTA